MAISTLQSPVPNILESKNSNYEYINQNENFTMISNISRFLVVVEKVYTNPSNDTADTIYYYGFGDDTFRKQV